MGATDLNIKWIFSDVDGVLTDGSVYYSQDGEVLKKFNVKDGMGFQLLKEKGFKVGLITKENSKIVERRASKLKLDAVFIGIENKLKILEKFMKENGCSLKNVAFIGDDVNDTELLKNVGFAAVPADAVEQNKKIASFICKRKGGDCAFREFAEELLKRFKRN